MRYSAMFAGLLILGASGGASAFGASPQLLNLVMPDAQVLAGLNVSTAKLSPFGQFLLTKIESQNDGLQKLIAVTGFDPLTDVVEILAASANPAKQSGLVALSGNFKSDQIRNVLGSNAAVTVGTYADATIFTFSAPKATTSASLAFIGSSIAILGDTVTVKAALDRNNSGASSLPAALTATISTLSGNNDAWLVSNSPAALLPAGLTSAAPGANQAAQFLSSIQSADAGVKFGASTQIAIDLTANNAQNAEALANVVRLLVGMVSMNAGDAAKNPQLAALLPLLQTLKVTTAGSDVDLALAVPESQLEGIVNNHPAGN